MSRRRDRHGWNSLDNYFQVHDRRIADFIAEGFVLRDGMVRDWPKPSTIVIAGRLRCIHGLFLDVEKFLAVAPTRSGGWRVKTETYSYHAGVAGDRNRTIFRYDNYHVYAREGHADAHHRHRFNHETWTEIEPPIWIGEERWPHLSDALDELRTWWETTGRRLELDH